MKARFRVATSLDIKHLCIRHARRWALAVIWLIYVAYLKSLLIVIPRSFTSVTALMVLLPRCKLTSFCCARRLICMAAHFLCEIVNCHFSDQATKVSSFCCRIV